ncbi:hypothetical protein KK083_07580 [Fulvivirgaceae bacterium PWU4]|uniref:DUF2306 domain-containing protein n=1 Tax=Chryseosolibacter histidini TaxID=2782349 RepID=A0AAP2GI40_9BACT|nr:hypothetical protein [Chryseosolibacter histidini]MBT1696729.1 hypothetical protein [Chryseosolibacter histidini]
MALSNLGIFHTTIGVIAIGAALTSFVKFAKINLAARSGKIYLYGTLITSLTALGISRHGGFNPGHAFSLLIIIVVAIASFLFYKRSGNNSVRYFENFLFSFSLFLSLIPTVNETLTRIPIAQPLAKDITDPVIAKSLLGIFIVFLGITVYQVVRQRKINRNTPSR